MDLEQMTDILACPVCKGDLEIIRTGERVGLKCANCQTAYPVIDNIPMMLVEEAIPLVEWEKEPPCAL